MGLDLSSAELRRVRQTQNILLAPLDHAQPGEWVAAAAGAIRDLLHADHATMLSGGMPAEILHTTLPADVQSAYIEHFAVRDMATPRALQRGLDVAHLFDVVRPDEFYSSELYHDYAVPNALHDAMLIRARTGRGRSMWVATQQGRRLDAAGVARRKALLELVQPAFAAGVRAFVQAKQVAADASTAAHTAHTAHPCQTLRARFGLTPREAEVALLLAERLTNREIAARLRISMHTAERHTERVLHKLAVESRLEVRSRLARQHPDQSY